MLSAEYQDDYQQPVCFVDRINDFNKIDNSIESLRTFMDVDQPEHDDININMHNNYLAKSQNLESNPIIVHLNPEVLTDGIQVTKSRDYLTW